MNSNRKFDVSLDGTILSYTTNQNAFVLTLALFVQSEQRKRENSNFWLPFFMYGTSMLSLLNPLNSVEIILGDPGADSGGERKSKRVEKYGTKKTKERREEPLGTMFYQTSSKWSPPFWLLIGQKNTTFSGTNQRPERRQPFGTCLVKHCPQRLFSPFFSFLCAIFFRPFRLSLAPTICPWVSEDEWR